MALHFIFGSSGSGKSNYIYEHILARSKAEPDRLFFVVVPEQFTLQTQRELVRRQADHGIMNIDVVSFQRLAYRVFDELGLKQLKVLEETGKSFVLRKVAEDKQDELVMLKGSMKKNGYINELKSVISELSQYRIGPEQLEKLSEDESLSMPFRCRMADIRTMYRGFVDYLEGNYITAEEVLEVLAGEAEHSAFLKDCVLVLDGFYGFTPIQYALLEQLMKCAGDMYVTVTLDGREKPFVIKGMQELFYTSKKTISSLVEIADRNHIAVEEPVQLYHGPDTRFGKAKPLEWLEQNLFREKPQPYPENCGSGIDADTDIDADSVVGAESNVKAGALEQTADTGGHQRILSSPEDCIILRSLPDPRQELIYLAGEIRRLVREEGYRYQDMAIVCGDVETYGNYVPEIFEQFEIPFFMDKKNTIAYHPMTELVKSALLVAEQDFSYESVMAYLRCGLAQIKIGEVDIFENYLLANRIRGSRRWSEKWVRLNGTGSSDDLSLVNRIREQILSRFREPMQVWRKKSSTVREKTVALYQFIIAHQVQEQLEERKNKLEQAGSLAKAKEYAQIYRLVMDLLNKLTLLLPEEKLDLTEYRQVLEAGLSASFVGIIPPGYDQVLVGDIERSRLGDIKILFLAGVNDGLIPKAESAGGLISQQEREIFAAHELELAPGIREKAFIQKFYLYLNMTKPSEKLYLTWFQVNGEGKEARRSYLVGIVQKLFPGIMMGRKKQGTGVSNSAMEPSAAGTKSAYIWDADFSRIVTEKSSERVLIEGLNRAKAGTVSPVFLALLSWYRNQESWSGRIEELLNAAFYTYESRSMSREVTRELYGKVLENSVTRLERFASCAYAHFLAYGIGVKERQLGEFAPVDMGSLFHEALERYSRKMEEEGYHWVDVPSDRQEAMAGEAVKETVEEAGYILFQDARTAYAIQRITRILKKTVDTITSQISRSSFEPEGYEVSFSFAQDLKSVNFTLSDEEKMRLKGRIDRMDVHHDGERLYVKVVDYKSGNTQFQLLSLYHGLQLQLVVYMNAAVELMKKKYPDKEVLPAGMFYYHIDDPVIEVKGTPSDEEIREKIFEELQLKGVGTDEADGSVSKKSQKAGAEELAVLSDFVNAKIRKIGQSIYRGDIRVNPYQLKDKSGCDYCPYRGICGFDGKVPGYGYRKLPEIKEKDEIIEKMREEISDGHDIYKGTTAGH